MSKIECEVPGYGPYREATEEWLQDVAAKKLELSYGIDRSISKSVTVNGQRMPVLGVYGCGAMGCTLALEDPSLVVKITTDPMEATLWEGVMRAQERDPEVLQAFAGVVSIREVKTPFKSVYWEIVREAIEPAFDIRQGSGRPMPRSVWYVIGEPNSQLYWYAGESLSAADIADDLEAQDYEPSEDQLVRAQMLLDGDRTLERMEDAIFKYHSELEFALADDDDVAALEAQNTGTFAVVTELMKLDGPWLGIRDGLLAYMKQEDEKLWPTDLHLGNLGWRKVCENDPPEQLVIYDFQGRRMRKNGRRRDSSKGRKR